MTPIQFPIIIPVWSPYKIDKTAGTQKHINNSVTLLRRKADFKSIFVFVRGEGRGKRYIRSTPSPAPPNPEDQLHLALAWNLALSGWQL